MGCGGIQPRETDFVGRAWCGRGLRDRHPSTTRPTARSLPLGARATGRQGGASTPSRSHSPRTSSARLVDRTATGATRPWRRQRAIASRPLAGPRPARTLTNSPRDTSPCTLDGPLISCRDRAPAAVTVAREPTAASSQPKGCAPTPCITAACGGGNSSPTAATPPPPPPFSFNGTWTGPIASNVPGVPPGTATVTITHTGSSLSGTWATVYPDSMFNSAGSFSGTASGMSLEGTLSPSIPTECPYTINATVSGNLMTGTYASFNCSGVLSGTISLTKQERRAARLARVGRSASGVAVIECRLS